MKKISEIIVQTLKNKGVRAIFGIPSIHNIGFYEALRNEPEIRHILCRQEGSATHMADGYARSGKGVGVVVASTGPGVAYTLSPLIEAWTSCSPVLVITSNVRLGQIDKNLGVLHEFFQQDALFRSITKKRVCLRPGDNISSWISEAVSTALSDRPGPVYVEVPHDLWDLEIDATQGDTPQYRVQPPRIPDVSAAAERLMRARQPMIIAGIEAVHGGIRDEIAELAEILYAPVMTDTGAKGILREDHPLSFGNATNSGAVKEIHRSSDTTLVIGSRLRYVDFKRRGISLPGLIQIDWDGEWIDRNFKSEIQLIGDVREIVALLIKHLQGVVSPDERRQAILNLQQSHRRFCDQTRKAAGTEAAFVTALRKAIPDNGILVSDNTILGYVAEQIYPSFRPLGLVPAKGASPIGFAFPAAIGLKIANPDTPVVALIGDGGFMYGAQELTTCVQNRVAFPVIVVNDKSFRMIDYLQQMNYHHGYQTTLVNPDFSAFAASFGVEAVSVDSPEKLNKAVKDSLISDKMCLIELNASFPNPPFGVF